MNKFYYVKSFLNIKFKGKFKFKHKNQLQTWNLKQHINPSKHLPNPPQGGNSFLSLLFISFSIKKISFHSFTHFLFSQSPSFLVSKKVKRLCVALSTPSTSKNLCVSLCKNIFISLRQAQDDNRVKQISKNLSYLNFKNYSNFSNPRS